MPLSVVKVGRLAMKSFLFTSDLDPVSSAACGDVTDSQRRLLMDLRSREPGCAQNVRVHRANNFGCFAVIGPGLLRSAEAGVPGWATVPETSALFFPGTPPHPLCGPRSTLPARTGRRPYGQRDRRARALPSWGTPHDHGEGKLDHKMRKPHVLYRCSTLAGLLVLAMPVGCKAPGLLRC